MRETALRIALMIIVGIVLAIPLLLALSAWFGLDRTMQHSRAAAALPTLEEGATEGLVQISANGMRFRAPGSRDSTATDPD